jgi:hypothetical protein
LSHCFCFILYYNSIQIQILTALIIPLSIDKISYFNDVETDNLLVDFSTEKTDRFFLFDINEISDFLNKLDIDDNYIATIEFIPEISKHKEDAPQMILSKPFLLNRLSSKTTLSKFIFERLNYMVDYYYLDDSIIQELENGIGPVIIINYSKFYFS